MFNLAFRKPPGRTSAKERRALRRLEKKFKARIDTPKFQERMMAAYMDLAVYGKAEIVIDEGILRP